MYDGPFDTGTIMQLQDLLWGLIWVGGYTIILDYFPKSFYLFFGKYIFFIVYLSFKKPLSLQKTLVALTAKKL
jgi:hypothetical protein